MLCCSVRYASPCVECLCVCGMRLLCLDGVYWTGVVVGCCWRDGVRVLFMTWHGMAWYRICIPREGVVCATLIDLCPLPSLSLGLPFPSAFPFPRPFPFPLPFPSCVVCSLFPVCTSVPSFVPSLSISLFSLDIAKKKTSLFPSFQP